MPKTLYVVGSVPTQHRIKGPAEDLYASHWFALARAYVTHFAQPDDKWVILSAKYGVLEPSREVKSYDEKHIVRNRAKRQNWNKGLVADLLDRTEPNDTIVIFAGQRQRENLIAPLRAEGRIIEIPMADLKLSQQKAWLRKKLEEAGVEGPEEEEASAPAQPPPSEV